MKRLKGEGGKTKKEGVNKKAKRGRGQVGHANCNNAGDKMITVERSVLVVRSLLYDVILFVSIQTWSVLPLCGRRWNNI